MPTRRHSASHAHKASSSPVHEGASLGTLRSLAIFGAELLSNPRPMGAMTPSSRFLARRVASCLPEQPEGYVVELGAGTGVITSALLKRGISPKRLIVVERSEKMAHLLSKRFPDLHVEAGDAVELGALLSRLLNGERVSHIVSSLPLRSLEPDTAARITREVGHALRWGGHFIQYTYDLRPRVHHRSLKDFHREKTSVVWINLPPARVDVFHFKKTGA